MLVCSLLSCLLLFTITCGVDQTGMVVCAALVHTGASCGLVGTAAALEGTHTRLHVTPRSARPLPAHAEASLTQCHVPAGPP